MVGSAKIRKRRLNIHCIFPISQYIHCTLLFHFILRALNKALRFCFLFSSQYFCLVAFPPRAAFSLHTHLLSVILFHRQLQPPRFHLLISPSNYASELFLFTPALFSFQGFISRTTAFLHKDREPIWMYSLFRTIIDSVTLIYNILWVHDRAANLLPPNAHHLPSLCIRLITGELLEHRGDTMCTWESDETRWNRSFSLHHSFTGEQESTARAPVRFASPRESLASTRRQQRRRIANIKSAVHLNLWDVAVCCLPSSAYMIHSQNRLGF